MLWSLTGGQNLRYFLRSQAKSRLNFRCYLQLINVIYGFWKVVIPIYIQLQFPFTENRDITQITILNALMTAWAGDLLGGDIIIWGRELLPPEKIVCKFFQMLWKMQKVFQNVFLRRFVCPSINRRSGNGDRMFFIIWALLPSQRTYKLNFEQLAVFVYALLLG